MSKQYKLAKINVSNPKVWIVIGVTVAGIVILAETRRRRLKSKNMVKEDFGAFIERFELSPFPQPPPPAARLSLSGLTFAIKDVFDVKEYVTGFGNPDWKRTHGEAERTAVVVTTLLKNGATCVGKTIMDELSFGITGENTHYGTPTNPLMPTHIPGGSSSGSAVAVASELVDFAIGTDTAGCVRLPAALCGVLGFRPSHGAISTIGVLPNSQSLDTVGFFGRDPSILHRVGHVLLQLNQVEPRRTRRFIIADDLFELSKVPQQKTVYVVSNVTEKLSGYQPPKHMNLGQHISSNVPSLKAFREQSTNLQNGTSTLKALSAVMFYLQSHEFKANHGEWVKTAKPRLGSDVSDRILPAIRTTHENIKAYYKVRTEMRAALYSLLKDDGILVVPTVADPPLKLNSKKGSSVVFYDRASALLSIASMSGCCQVTIPMGKHDGFPISVSFIAIHGADKFLLDTVLDMYTSIQEQVGIVSNLPQLPDMNGSMEASELLKEKGNAAYKGKQWNKAVTYYTEAIKLNEANATYYCNRAAAYLELGCFQQAEEDCSMAISLDKKNVKAYLRRGTAKEMLLYYKEALQEKLIVENLEEGSEALRMVNTTVLSMAFSRTLSQLEVAAMDQETDMDTGIVTKPSSTIYKLARVYKTVKYIGDAAWTQFKKSKGELNRLGSSAEKLSAELHWLAEKLAASGSAEDAVCQWASASNLAWVALSTESRLQGSLVRVSAFLLKQAREMGGEGSKRSKREEQRQTKMKMLMSWLPFLCRAKGSADTPLLSLDEKSEVERVLDEIIQSLRKEEEQEKVLSLWLHHFTHCPDSDWPNLRSCYQRWCQSSRVLLIKQQEYQNIEDIGL